MTGCRLQRGAIGARRVLLKSQGIHIKTARVEDDVLAVRREDTVLCVAECSAEAPKTRA